MTLSAVLPIKSRFRADRDTADDVALTVEYSVRAAQIAVHGLLGIDRKVPPITPQEDLFKTQFEALIKAFK